MLKTLRTGATGTEVSALRALLGMEDGEHYDAGVKQSVAAFQSMNGLDRDGVCGPATWTALSKAAKTVRSGSTGKHVTALQYLIGGVDADGKYGSVTKSHVVAFQAAHSLTADGICGPATWSALITGAADKPEAGGAPNAKPKDYKQGGSPWGPKMYSSTGNRSQTYANSACGPTAAANVVFTFWDKTVTPETLGKLAVANGFRSASNGTDWAFFKFIANRYGCSKFIQTNSLATLKAALDAGALAVASMGPGYWTKGGHFITPWKHDGEYIYCNDPASSARTRQKLSQFDREKKQFFIFYK